MTVERLALDANTGVDIPVLVLGGGPAGLMTCLLLAKYGVRSLPGEAV